MNRMGAIKSLKVASLRGVLIEYLSPVHAALTGKLSMFAVPNRGELVMVLPSPPPRFWPACDAEAYLAPTRASALLLQVSVAIGLKVATLKKFSVVVFGLPLFEKQIQAVQSSHPTSLAKIVPVASRFIRQVTTRDLRRAQ